MHLYSRAVGLKGISHRTAMDQLIKKLIEQAVANDKVQFWADAESQDGYYEAQINAAILQEELGGIAIRGLYHPILKKFRMIFYYPYLKGRQPRRSSEVMIERQSDKEAYMAHCNESSREVAPIFFLTNIVEYLINSGARRSFPEKDVLMSAMAVEGKIIFPIKKTKEQIAKCEAAARKRSSLVDKAMQGDQDAIDSLTIGDYDTLASICRRINREDVYSIVDSSFIPSGMECDSYSVIGNIKDVKRIRNIITDEEIYYMTLECNDIEFDLGIHREDLIGMPLRGYRFAGKIWLQGSLVF